MTAEDPIRAADPIPTPSSPPPDILRAASMELVVTDLAASRNFYVDVLGLVVTEEDEETVYLRSFEEFIHHNLVLRTGPVAAVAALSYRVRSPEDLDKAVAFYRELGCRVERRADGFATGVGDSVRVAGPARVPLRVLPRRPARRAARVALRPVHAGHARAPRPLQPGHPRRAAGRGATWRTSGSG